MQCAVICRSQPQLLWDTAACPEDEMPKVLYCRGCLLGDGNATAVGSPFGRGAWPNGGLHLSSLCPPLAVQLRAPHPGAEGAGHIVLEKRRGRSKRALLQNHQASAHRRATRRHSRELGPEVKDSFSPSLFVMPSENTWQ